MPLMLKDGRVFNVADADVEAALQQGLVAAPPEMVERLVSRQKEQILQSEYGDTGSQVATALLGVGRTATLGATDVFAKKFMGEKLRLLQEANPISNLVGEIGGIGTSLLVTKKFNVKTPTSMISTAGETASQAVSRTILRGVTDPSLTQRVASKLLSGAARGATEAGIFGAGMGVSQTAMEGSILDIPLLAENVASHVISDGLFGAALGGGGGLLGELAGSTKKAVISKIADRVKKAGPALEDGAMFNAFEAMGHKPAQATEVIKNIRSSRGGEEKWAHLKSLLFDGGAVPGPTGFEPILKKGQSVADVADRLKEALDSWGEVLGVSRQGLKGKQVADPNALLSAFEDTVAPFRSPHQSGGMGDAIKRWTEKLRVALKQDEFKDYVIDPVSLQDIKQDLSAAWTTRHGRLNTGKDVVRLQRALYEVTSNFQDDLMRKGLSADEFQTYKLAMRNYSTLADLAKTSKKASLHEAAAPIGHRMASYALRSAIWRLPGANLATVAKIVGTSTAVYGGAGVLGEVANKSSMALRLDKIAKTGIFERQSRAIATRVEGAAEVAIGKKKSAVFYPTVNVLSKFGESDDPDEARRNLQAKLSDSAGIERRTAMLLQDAHEGAPQITQQASTTLGAAMAMLQQDLQPEEDLSNPLQPLLHASKMSESQIAKVNAKLQALHDPLAVLDRAADGEIDPEQALVLRQVYPQLVQRFRQVLTEKLAEEKEPLSYEKLVALSILFGESLVGTMNTMPPAAMAQGQGPGGIRKSGLDKLDKLADAAKSPLQRTAERVG